MRVPMQGTGAEQLVVALKVLKWNRSEGVALSGFIDWINQEWEESYG